MKDTNQFEKILKNITGIGIYVIREDTHEILYFNDTVQRVTPDIEIGQICHEVWRGTCENCPLLNIGDKETNTTVNFNDPFGEIVDITATRILWENHLPAFIIITTPHLLTEQERNLKLQAEIEQQRNRYKQALETVNDVIFEYDVEKDLFITFENVSENGVKRIAKYEFGNYHTFIKDTDTIHPDYTELLLSKVDSYDINGLEILMKPLHEEEYHWFSLNGNTLYENDRPVRIIGILRDINEYKLMEEEQKYLERICSFTVNRDYNLVVTLDLKTSLYTIRSSSLKDVYYLEESGDYQTAVDMICKVAVHPDDRPGFSKLFHKDALIKTLSSGDTEKDLFCRILSNDRTFRWKRIRVTYFNSKKTKILLTVQDIEEDRQTKAREIMANQILAVAFRELYDRIYEADLVTDELQEIYCTPEGVIGKVPVGNLREIINRWGNECVHPDSKERFFLETDLSTLPQRLEKSSRIYYEIRRTSDSGEYRWYAVQIQFLSASEDSYKILWYRQDIDESRKIDERNKQMLEDALQMAENANRAKSDFISRMSHDIRTPMNAIIGMTAIAAANLENPAKIEDCLSKIGLSARFLLTLINDILDMSKIESGKIIITRQLFNFHTMIQNLSSVFTIQAQEKNLHFHVHMEKGFPVGCTGDELRINQILMNLIGNAMKFTPSGGSVTLRIQRKKARNQTVWVCMEVEDTGIGISKQFQRKIFDPFEQETSRQGKVYEGTGLGMTITKSLVQLMGGKISLESEEGKGSKFSVELPLEVDDQPELENDAGFDLSSLHVLIVDDDIITCEHTQMILNQIGIQPAWASSGEMAIREIQEAKARGLYYDVAFVDWQMPEMDGVETVRRIRSIVGMETLVIIMSAYDWGEIEEEARAAGVDMFISKPMFPENVHRALNNLQRQTPINAEEKKEYEFHGERILLVEDNEINMEIAKTLLEMKGLTVETAFHGQEALDQLKSSPPDWYKVILMDIRMPVMDGITATRNIRNMERDDIQKLPIVAMTADAFEEDQEYAEQIGMNGYLIKPIEPERLYKALDQLLNQGFPRLYL